MQTWIAQKVAKNLSESLHTHVSIKGVDFEFFNKLEIKGVLIEDQKKDTLLYAGSAKVNINDWFFLKDNIELQYISLEDAYINANRTDSVWNYQFIADYFDTPSNPNKKKSKGAELHLTELHLLNVKVKQNDGWIGTDMNTFIGKLDLFVNKIDYEKKILDIRSLDIDTPLFMQADYDGKRPADYSPGVVLQKIPVVNAFKWNNSGWKVSMASLVIKKGIFQNEKQTERAPYTDQFDGQHLLFQNINGNFKNFTAWNDTISADILLTAQERSGLHIQKLQARIKFTPEMMEFSNLDLITNKSHLRNYYAMHYQSFNHDMSEYIHNVAMEARFTQSELHSDDLAIFAPTLKNWNRIFKLEGDAKGTVDNFSIKRMKIATGNSYVDGNLTMRGLPDVNSTFIDLKSNRLNTTYNEMTLLVPSLKNITQPKLSRLGNIGFTGTFTGFMDDFVTYGTLSTSLGTIVADVNMKLPENGIPKYKGKLFTNGFNVGKLIDNNEFGVLALNGKVSGEGFSLKELNSNFDGNVKRFYFNGYNYQNISLSGNFKNRLFTGHLQSDDPNVKIRTIDGTVNFGVSAMTINAAADIQKINLQALGFSTSKLSLSGLFALNFSGNKIDNFLGTAKVYDAVLIHDTTKLSFDYLTLVSDTANGEKSLTLQSNQVDANITGKFSIADLPESFKYFLNRYYPNYIPKPAYAVKNQDFTIDIRTRQIEEYVQLIDNRIKGLNDSHLYGRLDMNNYILSLNATSPEFFYDGKKFSNINLTGSGNSDTLTADVTVDNIEVSDSLHFPSTQLHLSAHNDISDISLKTSAGDYVSDAELNASIQTLKDGVKIRFFPSSFVLNDKKWMLEKDGELVIQKNYVHADEIRFIQGDQEIEISTAISPENNETNIVANLKKVNIGDFLPFIITEPDVKGILTGTAVLRDPFGKMIIDFKGTSDSTTLEGNYVGSLQLDASANTKTGLVTFNGDVNDSTNTLHISGFVNTKDSTGNQLKIDMLSKRINLKILQPYLNTIFSDMSGFAETNLVLSGTTAHPFLTGDATIDSGSVIVAYTKCKYLLTDQKIVFRKDEIDLGRMRLRDTLRNEGVVSGKMYHEFFKKLRFDNIRLETAKLALLHTTRKDNAQFYGNVIGDAVMRINGPITNLQMDITGAPSELDSSHIFLTSGSTKESNAIDYIDFIQFGEQMDTAISQEATNIFVNLNITANPACIVDVILDETTKDIIRGQGNGSINIRVGTTEPLSIRGQYEIVAGYYDFNFQTFFKRPFTLSRGGYIRWTGDPLAANINLKAEYLAKNVDISTIASSGGFKQKEDITIVAKLSGILQKPDIDFEFRLPEKSVIRNDYIAVRKLADYQNDKTEMNKQIASLLLFNQFLSTEGSFLSYENTFSIANNFIGGIISGWLTNLLNKQLEKATNGIVTSYVDINPTLNLQSTANQLQANIRAGLKIFFSNRLIFLVGGNIEYNNPTLVQLIGREAITPDISIEWILNKEGSLRVVGFNRSSFDFTQTRRNSSGVQLTYRKEFNYISDIFKSRKTIDSLIMQRHAQIRTEPN